MRWNVWRIVKTLVFYAAFHLRNVSLKYAKDAELLKKITTRNKMLTIELPKAPSRYWYKVRTDQIRVIDGDTIECLTDLTHGVHIDATYRLASINAPEMKGRTKKAAEVSAGFVREWLYSAGNFVWLKSLKNRGKDKQIQTFGRYVAYVFGPDGGCLNVEMVAGGYAVEYMIELITEDSFEVKK